MAGINLSASIGLPTPYVTLAVADDLLVSAEWIAATDDDKSEALSYARIFIDSKFICNFPEDNPPTEVQVGNALLAERRLIDGTLLPLETGKGLKRTKVKAGSVSTEKEYNAYASKNPDKYPDIMALIGVTCNRSTGGTVWAIRS